MAGASDICPSLLPVTKAKPVAGQQQQQAGHKPPDCGNCNRNRTSRSAGRTLITATGEGRVAHDGSPIKSRSCPQEAACEHVEEENQLACSSSEGGVRDRRRLQADSGME
jgi:hypothetical protein